MAEPAPAAPGLLALSLSPFPYPQQHVQDGRKENLEGFVRTFEKELSEDAHAGVYALDCEMVGSVGTGTRQRRASTGARAEPSRAREA